MKNARVKVRNGCNGKWWDFGVFDGRKMLMVNENGLWQTEKVATRNAKAMAKRIGIKYDIEIIKQHGC